MALRTATVALLSFLVACSGDGPSGPDAGSECVPGDCSPFGQACGQHVDPASGACLICGRCTAPLLCGGAGMPGQCGCAPPRCNAEQCGEIADPCGGPAIACSKMCAQDETCGGGGVPNACGQTAARGEACSATRTCAMGDRCCDSVCRASGPGGMCPVPGPDLTVDAAALVGFYFETKTVTPTECSIADRCLPGPGTYELLRFATHTINVGTADLVIGSPTTSPNDFAFAMCHAHFHYTGYVEYRLLDMQGQAVTTGFKAGFCIEDTIRTMDPGAPVLARFFCDPMMGTLQGVQGIQKGWSDLYQASLDCQWVDVTRVPAGDYTLEIEVNPPPRRFVEASYDNNIARIAVTVH